MQQRKFILFTIFLFIYGINSYAQPRIRPSNWAHVVIGSDLHNFYQVSPELYRSAQPDKNDFVDLQSLGIAEILNLRKHHTDIDEAKQSDIKLNHLRLSARNMSESQVFDALKIIKDASGPTLVHCWHGSDRTGTVVAAYRMVFQHWDAKQAIDEFKNGGFGYHSRTFPNLEVLLSQLDVKKLRVKLGLVQSDLSKEME